MGARKVIRTMMHLQHQALHSRRPLIQVVLLPKLARPTGSVASFKSNLPLTRRGPFTPTPLTMPLVVFTPFPIRIALAEATLPLPAALQRTATMLLVGRFLKVILTVPYLAPPTADLLLW